MTYRIGLSVTDLTFAWICGPSWANLSSTRITPSFVVKKATLPPLPMITYRFAVTFSRVSCAGCCACDHAIHRPAVATVTSMLLSTSCFRIITLILPQRYWKVYPEPSCRAPGEDSVRRRDIRRDESHKTRRF